MPNKTSDNKEEIEPSTNSAKQCSYCNKKLTKRWQNRANNSLRGYDWDSRAMHGTCYKKQSLDRLHETDMKNWMVQKQVQKEMELHKRLINPDAKPCNEVPAKNNKI